MLDRLLRLPLRTLMTLTTLAAFLALGAKLGDTARELRGLLGIEDAVAEPPAKADAAKPDAAKPDAAKPEAAKPEAAKPDAAKPAEPEAKPADKKADAEKKPDAEKAAGPKVTVPSTEAGPDGEETKHDYSQTEIDLLQSLAKRRQQIDEWAKQVQLKENMLAAAEQRLNDKITSLQTMKKELEKLLTQYNEQEDMKIRSLVKIYESMKPKDAGRIFEELDMPVLLTVVDRMSERKVSLILSNMSPTKAKDVTVQLAQEHKLQKSGQDAPAPSVDAPGDAGAAPPAGR